MCGSLYSLICKILMWHTSIGGCIRGVLHLVLIEFKLLIRLCFASHTFLIFLIWLGHFITLSLIFAAYLIVLRCFLYGLLILHEIQFVLKSHWMYALLIFPLFWFGNAVVMQCRQVLSCSKIKIEVCSLSYLSPFQ